MLGNMAAAFETIFGGLDSYRDGTLHRIVLTPNGKGGGTSAAADIPVRVQVDQATQAMRQAEGFAETDVQLIVLASSLREYSPDDPELKDNDEITIGTGPTYKVIAPKCDPLVTHWRARGRKKS